MLGAKEETMPSNRRVFLVGGLAFGWGAVAAVGALARQDKADYDSPPRATKVTRPEYPPEALEKGIEGTVVVEMTIDVEGRVVDPSVAKSVEGLDEAALECVREWRFKPATKDGEAVPATARAPVTFRLKDAKKP
jgi:protein TonB